MTDCPQACDEALLALLARTAEQQQQGDGGADIDALLDAYSCHTLFPEPGTSSDAASFAPVHGVLAKRLVSRFGDALATLNWPELHQQLLQLPAVAVGDLLRADEFGTDSEDSIFLLLACWLHANEADAPEEARAALCKLIRLHQLDSPYLHFVLPTYSPFSNVSRAELAFLLRYVGAGEQAAAQHEQWRLAAALSLVLLPCAASGGS